MVGLSIIGLGIGGKIYMDHKHLKDEMIKVVESDEAKKEFEVELKKLDSKSLTSEGKIKSYRIDYNTVEHNPMGGIIFKGYVNGDKNLSFNSGFNRYIDGNTYQYGKIESTGIDITLELDNFINGDNNHE